MKLVLPKSVKLSLLHKSHRDVASHLGEFFVVEKDFIGYKKVRNAYNNRHEVIELLIPRGAAVYVTNHKCRASEAAVVKMRAKQATGMYYPAKYELGAFMEPSKQFNSKFEVCATGIHFFMYKTQAKDFQ